jgi:hypothetical protein
VAAKPAARLTRISLAADAVRGDQAQTGVVSTARTWPAAVTLFFLAGLIPESIATFNSPPRLLLARPAAFVFISAFYGSVALLVREYMRRRASGWPGVLLLGLAAGAVNEGIIAGTWYKVQYPGYAMIGGFDPAVAVGLTVFHALVSTLLPIALVELMFPAVASVRWLRPAGRWLCLVLLAITTATGFAATTHQGPRLAVLAGVLATVAVALRLADQPAHATPRPAPSVGRLRLAGAGATVTFYSLFAVVPGLVAAGVPAAARRPWQLLFMLLMAGFCWVVVDVGRDWVTRTGWGGRQRLAAITGVLLPAIFASVLLPVGWQGLEPLVTLPALGLLCWLSRQYQPRLAQSDTAPPSGYQT